MNACDASRSARRGRRVRQAVVVVPPSLMQPGNSPARAAAAVPIFPRNTESVHAGVKSSQVKSTHAHTWSCWTFTSERRWWARMMDSRSRATDLES